MKKLVAPILALSLALSASTAFAGGPVVITEEPPVVAETPRSGWILPVIIGLIVVCAIACGDDESST